MPKDDRAPVAKAVDLVSRIFSACAAFALPPVLGNWCDNRWQTGYLFTLIGLGFGAIAGGWLLYKLTQIKPAG
jgi:hypothetical protein